MTPTAAVLVIGGITRIVARHEPGTHKVRDRPADIGTANGQDLLFDRVIDTCCIGVRIAGQLVLKRDRYAGPQACAAHALLAHGKKLGA